MFFVLDPSHLINDPLGLPKFGGEDVRLGQPQRVVPDPENCSDQLLSRGEGDVDIVSLLRDDGGEGGGVYEILEGRKQLRKANTGNGHFALGNGHLPWAMGMEFVVVLIKISRETFKAMPMMTLLTNDEEN